MYFVGCDVYDLITNIMDKLIYFFTKDENVNGTGQTGYYINCSNGASGWAGMQEPDESIPPFQYYLFLENLWLGCDNQIDPEYLGKLEAFYSGC